jgi:hypothetical protein
MGLASSPVCLVLCAAALVAATTPSAVAAATATASSTAATLASPHILQHTTKARIPNDACTFRVYEVQTCNAPVAPALLPPSIATYIRVDKVLAGDGSVAVDVAAKRPRQQGNSYQKLEPEEQFKLASFKDGEVLEVAMGSQGVEFSFGKFEWGVWNGIVEEGKAWCEAGGWTHGNEEWTCENGLDGRNRVSRLVLGRNTSSR